MRQLLKDSGKRVRRNGTIDHSFSSTQSTSSSNPGGKTYPALASGLYEKPETEFVTTSSSTKFSFAGRFMYHIIDPRSFDGGIFAIPSRERYQLQRILFGGEITPQTLYQIMPWSWLIDWVVPIGSIIDNFVNDSVDGLVADYAYVSGHQTTKLERVVQGKLRNGPTYECSSVLLDEVKQRTRASPYGFGLAFSGFSLKRLAILAALGFTKLS
jgi:hypothetical protein